MAGAALILAAAGCGLGGGDQQSILDKEVLVVGVKPDQPGLGLRKGGEYEGFDVDVAKYVTRKLGFENVTFIPAPSAQREKMLQEGQVDLIFATYSITPERKTKVDFSGPYYVAHQDTLVRASDAAVIDNVRDLKGRNLCQVTGSNSWRRVKEERKVAVNLVEAPSYSDCIAKLKSGEVDAVSTDDLILAGFAGAETRSVKIINAPFTDERYGVGIKKGDIDGCEAVNKAITEMYQDGTAEKLLHKWFGPTGLNLTTTVPQFEGCG